jgi:transcription elongation factor Elf1
MLYFLTEYDEIKPREPRIISKINCPNCGSNEHVIRNGHDKYGRQNWQCLICLKQWLDEKIRISKKIEPIPILPFSDFTLELKQLSKKPITLDSLEGIPCFSSECISKNHCDPSNCEKLEKWCLDVQETR